MYPYQWVAIIWLESTVNVNYLTNKLQALWKLFDVWLFLLGPFRVKYITNKEWTSNRFDSFYNLMTVFIDGGSWYIHQLLFNCFEALGTFFQLNKYLNTVMISIHNRLLPWNSWHSTPVHDKVSLTWWPDYYKNFEQKSAWLPCWNQTYEYFKFSLKFSARCFLFLL